MCATNGDRAVLVLGGPTGSGKTEAAIALAKRYDAEIVGADSRQIYRDMPVGTAAPTAEQRAIVAHHLVAFVDPYERYSAARFVTDAAAAIASIHARGKRAIVTGGTGFYLRALCGDVVLAAEPDPLVRARVQREVRTHPPDMLYEWLRLRDPGRAAALSPHDRYRVVRALEVDLARRARCDTPRERAPLPTLRRMGIPFAKVALRIDPESLAARIALRTRAMLRDGLLDEAERIGLAAVASDAVGYREALAYRSGWLTFAELEAQLARATRRYAKRQLTWFRGEPDLTWVDATDDSALGRIVEAIGWSSGHAG